MNTKMTCLVLLMSLSQLLSAQVYKPFSGNSKKIFVDTLGRAHSLAFEQVNTLGSDSIFHGFLTIQSDFYFSDSCSFWGGNQCLKQTLPPWFGTKVTTNNAGSYLFYTRFGDALNFQFQNYLDTTLIYSNANLQLRMHYTGTDTINLLGIIDSVASYELMLSDSAGNPVTSPIGQQAWRIGKQLGLISCFQIDSFPFVQKNMWLVGDEQQHAGVYAINNELIYNYEVGDVLQWHQAYSVYSPINPMNYDLYRKYRILSKSVTSDSLFYQVEEEVFSVNQGTAIIDTFNLVYHRFESLATIPFEKFDGHYRKLELESYCGQLRWKYTDKPEPYLLNFCAIDTCWGSADTGGPAQQGETVYVSGIGIFASNYYVSAPPPYGMSQYNNLGYALLNNVACGTQAVVGLSNSLHELNVVSVYPSPASQMLSITAKNAFGRVLIFNLLGEKIWDQTTPYNDLIIDVSDWPEGIYFMDLEDSNQKANRTKFLVIHQ